jgi:hypothetical protein
MKISMGHRWNNTERGKLKYLEKNLSHCHFIYHKSHMDWPGIEACVSVVEAGGCLRQVMPF